MPGMESCLHSSCVWVNRKYKDSPRYVYIGVYTELKSVLE